MGRKCNVLDCPSDSKRSEDNGVTFHKMPFHPDLRPKWIELCRIPEERQINKIIYVCSRHFRRTDFCNFKGTKYMLRQGALPSVFPWTKSLIKPTQQNSKITIPNEDGSEDIDIKDEPIDEYEEVNDKPNVEAIDPLEPEIKDEPPEEPEEEIEKPETPKETPPLTKKDSPATTKKESPSSTKKESPSSTKKESSTSKKEPAATVEKDPTATVKKEPPVTVKKEAASKVKKEAAAIVKKEAAASVKKEAAATVKKEPAATVKKEPAAKVKKEPATSVKKESTEKNKKEPSATTKKESSGTVKKELAATVKKEMIEKTVLEIKAEPINFLPGARIEANDFNEKWYPATILEVDYDENEVFVEFDKLLNKANEWIPMDSSRLRPYQPSNNKTETYIVGERVMATWIQSCNKFPATIRKVIDADTYEVLFDDGFSKILKHQKIAKVKDQSKPKLPVHHVSPLFDPVVGSKEDRRERKRKLNVAELFGRPTPKKFKDEYVKSEPEDDVQSQEEFRSTGSSSQCEGEEWTCRWLNGEPVGVESELESLDGPRRSIIVADHRLPPGWEKHLSQRMNGSHAGKWDTIILNPQGKRFSNRNMIKVWLEDQKLDYNVERFDFCLHINRARKLGLYEVTDPEALAASKPAFFKKFKTTKESSKSHKAFTPKSGSNIHLPTTPEIIHNEPEIEDSGCLKIIHEDGSYKCPIEGCGKIFRKENLAQMHVKHYHPESAKLMGSTPNVADLAYARTVGEHIDDIVPKNRSVGSPLEKEKQIKIDSTPKPKSTLKILTPKLKEENDARKFEKPGLTSPISASKFGKDSEIIKLLNSEPKSKTFDSIFDTVASKSNEIIHKLTEDTSNVPSTPDKYPEIKLKDLLHKAEPIPIKKDEHRPTGIKTLLPVIRHPIEDIKLEDDFEQNLKSHSISKIKPGRKRQSSDHSEAKRRRQSFKYDTDDMSDFFEADSRSNEAFKHKVLEQLQPAEPVGDSSQVIIEGGEVIRLVHMRSEEIINCTCGITEEDGLMIQCELCLCWQHAHCNNIQRENEVPDKYVCKICKNPKKMRASKKYLHDQEWLKQGTLASSNIHAKDEEFLKGKYEKLRKSHELSGCMVELNEYIHNLRLKLSVADSKDHPKLYLWNKPWEKPIPNENLNALLTKTDVKQEIKEDNLNSSFSGSDHSYIKSSTFGDVALKTLLEPPVGQIKLEEKPQIDDDTKIKSESELLSILTDGDPVTTTEDQIKTEPAEFPKIDLNSMITNNLADKIEPKDENINMTEDNKENALNTITSGLLSSGSLELALSHTDLVTSFAQLNEVVATNEVAVHIPQPEAVIDPADCRMNLLEHVQHFQGLVDERLNSIEAEISELEDQEDSNLGPDDDEDSSPKMKQSLQMLIKDLSTMRQISSLTN